MKVSFRGLNQPGGVAGGALRANNTFIAIFHFTISDFVAIFSNVIILIWLKTIFFSKLIVRGEKSKIGYSIKTALPFFKSLTFSYDIFKRQWPISFLKNAMSYCVITILNWRKDRTLVIAHGLKYILLWH